MTRIEPTERTARTALSPEAVPGSRNDKLTANRLEMIVKLVVVCLGSTVVDAKERLQDGKQIRNRFDGCFDLDPRRLLRIPAVLTKPLDNSCLLLVSPAIWSLLGWHEEELQVHGAVDRTSKLCCKKHGMQCALPPPPKL